MSYDAIGNPTNYMGAAMTWYGRQLMTYSKSGTSVNYTYDGNGLRTRKTVGSDVYDYYYVDGQLAYEKKNEEYQLFYSYDTDGRLAMHRELWDGKGNHFKHVANLMLEHPGCKECRDIDGEYQHTGNEVVDRLYIDTVKREKEHSYHDSQRSQRPAFR